MFLQLIFFFIHSYDDDDDWSLTDMMFDMAVTVVPIGLLLSALPTGLFTFAIRRLAFFPLPISSTLSPMNHGNISHLQICSGL